jgi:hypothetical protein
MLEGPLRFEPITGLSNEQLLQLVIGVRDHTDFAPRGRQYVLGLYRSVALVVFCLRENPTQTVAAAVFGVSQSTVSRRCDALREPIAAALAAWVPDPHEATRGSTVLVDGSLARTWDWRHRDDLYSGKHRDTGFNLQIAATLEGRLLAIGAPIPGARHDAYAWKASGLAHKLADIDTLADLGYIGLNLLTGTRKPIGRDLTDNEKETNTALSAIRAAVEQSISHLKNWKILGGRCRAPLDKYASIVETVAALHFYKFNSAL